MEKILYTMRNYPARLNPEADFNVDNSLDHRLTPEQIRQILTGEKES